ncbi:unnamed protein product [Ectocarpus sp. 12 AP-2014]
MPEVPRIQQWPRGPTNPLHHAADCGSFEAAAAVVASGAFDIDQGNEFGWTALMMASRGGHSRIVRMLLIKGAQVLIANDLDATALHQSVLGGHLAVTKMLVEAGAPLEAVTKEQLWTPLHFAARNGCAESITTLLEAGANLNSRQSDGATPLYIAALQGNVSASRLLLLAKADPLLTCAPDSPEDIFLPLDAAAVKGHAEVVHELIRQVGIDGCGGSSGGEHALRQAALSRHLDIMAILTNAGVVDTSGLALRMTAGFGGEASVQFLLEQARARKTMDLPAYVNARDCCGMTPLLCAIQSHGPCSSRVVRLLVEAGADTTSAVVVCSQPEEDGFSITPLGFTVGFLRHKVAGTGTSPKEQLNELEAIRRLLLRVEAVHAASWLWSSDVSTIAHATTKGTDKTTVTSTAGTPPMLMMRRRTRGREVPLAALLRYSSKP